MKKLLVFVFLFWSLGATAYAGEYETVCPEGYKATVAPEGAHHFRPSCYMDTDTDTDTDTLGEPQDEFGVGTDIVLWKSDAAEPLLEEVTGEYRYDLENENHSAYAVVRVDLWSKLKSFFSSEE